MSRRAKFAPGAKGESSEGAGLSRPLDPITRTALRYTVSPEEYSLLHSYLLSRSKALAKKAPGPLSYATETAARGGDYNATAIRAALRLFALSMGGLKLANLAVTALEKIQKSRGRASKISWSIPKFRLSAALGLILLFHRLLYRFLFRLRGSLLLPSARPFTIRNPTVAKILSSRYAPPLGASLAGSFLALYPATQLRITVTVYALSRALEFAFNALEIDGVFSDAPDWMGTWMLLPFSCAQLFYTMIFHPDCLPSAVSKAAFGFGGPYLQTHPKGVPGSDYITDPALWPSSAELVEGVGEVSKLGWPRYTSPIVLPNSPLAHLPDSMTRLARVAVPAHPATAHLSCALLHPEDPSCARTYFRFYLSELPRLSKLLGLAIGSVSLVTRFRELVTDPTTLLGQTLSLVFRSSLALTGGLATSWGSLCLFNSALPSSFLPKGRVYLAGLLAGLWAYLLHSPHPRSRILHPNAGPGAASVVPASAVAAATKLAARTPGTRSQFMSAFRYALASAWRVEQKKFHRGPVSAAAKAALVANASAATVAGKTSLSRSSALLLWLIRLPLTLFRKLSGSLRKNADVLVFVASLAAIQVLYVARPPAIQGKIIRVGCSWLLGEGAVDRCEVVDAAVEKERLSRKMDELRKARKAEKPSENSLWNDAAAKETAAGATD